MANLKEKQEAEPDTVSKLWSVAKTLTSIETMRLGEDGLKKLDVPLTGYFPQFSIQTRFPNAALITVRNNLTHRSGLPRSGCYLVNFNPDLLADLTVSINNCYQTNPVCYKYHYSNIGFDTLGYLIEKMREEPYP